MPKEIQAEFMETPFQRVTPKAESFSISVFKEELIEISVNGKVVKQLVVPVNGNLACYFNKSNVQQSRY